MLFLVSACEVKEPDYNSHSFLAILRPQFISERKTIKSDALFFKISIIQSYIHDEVFHPQTSTDVNLVSCDM